MATLTRRDLDHIFQQLRQGTVPDRGLDAFAVGIEAERAELHRMLDLVAGGEGEVKFLRGDYGCGKTFMARLALLDARARGFATSFAVVSDNDLRFHKFEELYARIMADLGTASCPRGALGDILDRWVAGIEERLAARGADEDAPDFGDQVRAELEAELLALSGGKAPPDFVRVVQTVFRLKDAGDLAEAGALLSWLAGSANVGAAAKKTAGIKGEIGSRDALEFLRGVVHIVRAAGYRGLAVVVDETETLLRSRSDTRGRSLNGLRQIVDAAGSYPGLLWLFTGTPEFFDNPRGVKGLPPLHDRIRFQSHGGFANLRQPQLNLRPFDAARLDAVAQRLRALYPAADAARLEERVSDAFIDRLVADVTDGFGGDVGVVPRQFLRAFVDQLDLVDQNPDYDPMVHYAFEVEAETTEEQARRTGELRIVAPADDGPVLVEDVW
jgi:hypothetical protein